MDNLSNQPAPDQLTQRELEILRLMADGLANQDIAERLFISLNTVKWYLKQIYGKLHVSSRTQAIAAAHARDLLDARLQPAEQLVPRHSLPQHSTPFVGRSAELSTIAERLRDPACRLLTLIGAGGVGKTRLAVQATHDNAAAFPHGIH